MKATIEELVSQYDAIVEGQKPVILLAEVTDDWVVYGFNEDLINTITDELYKRGRYSDGTKLHPLSRVGVTFTPEQEAQIRALVGNNEIVEAQRIILDGLKKEFGEDDQ